MNASSTSTLTLDNVYILVYDLSLTKTYYLRQTTIKILKEKTLNVASDTTQRQTRSMTHNYSEVGLQLDAHISLNKVKSLSITPSCQSIVVTFLSARGPEKRIGVLQKKQNEYIYYYKERMLQLGQRIQRMNDNVGQKGLEIGVEPE